LKLESIADWILQPIKIVSKEISSTPFDSQNRMENREGKNERRYCVPKFVNRESQSTYSRLKKNKKEGQIRPLLIVEIRKRQEESTKNLPELVRMVIAKMNVQPMKIGQKRVSA
jgi:hypothetical protein